MAKYIIELSDYLSTIYEDLAKMSNRSTEEILQIILEKVIDTLLGHPTYPQS